MWRTHGGRCVSALKKVTACLVIIRIAFHYTGVLEEQQLIQFYLFCITTGLIKLILTLEKYLPTPVSPKEASPAQSSSPLSLLLSPPKTDSQSSVAPRSRCDTPRRKRFRGKQPISGGLGVAGQDKPSSSSASAEASGDGGSEESEKAERVERPERREDGSEPRSSTFVSNGAKTEGAKA